ncbi:hypothetical protein ES332_A13G048800v1 [Gossypium tomentosum]|uniref:Reticulon-like protein n=1 Tax=Gossypium tomentosum TaxID=34277 RepID=A0A5D2MG22_GOSTO|nr:hypothetical protein ES332_A13G048800v1 [Gossypium tomentosum]TYH90452.1 hypothetical protein ES332_A13G048800v1 [Gossypium tomentosum]
MAMGDSVPTPRISVHQAFGGGLVADVLLWRKWCGGVVMLASATAFWCLFELAGYSILSFVANVLLLLVVILFFWAKSASLLNRPLPPLPNLEISERTAGKIADELQVWVNIALSIAHDITLGRNLKLLFKVGVALWFVSFIGSFLSFLTVVYIGVILSLSVPVLYDKYQHHIDEKLSVTNKIIQTQYRKIDEAVLRKLPLPSKKEKKMQ